MDRDETVALFLECEAKRAAAWASALSEGKYEYEAKEVAHEAAKAHWNTWAKHLIAERKAMEAAGMWKPRWKSRWKSRWNYSWWPEEGENPETQAWLDKAFADFSSCLFLVRGPEGTGKTDGESKKEGGDSGLPIKTIQLDAESIDFRGFIFPSDARFVSATFTGDAWFVSVTFNGNASFESAAFAGYARLESATFTGSVWFDSATFTGDARFLRATFTDIASFDSAAFTGDARFDSAAFTDDTRFVSATFTGDAQFVGVTFTGYARFERANFIGDTSFESTWFGDRAQFRGINSQGAFSLIGARFRRHVPNFLSAKFAEPVLLDNIQLAAGVRPGGFLRSNLTGLFLWIYGELDTALSAKYRRLKQLAIQSDDHRNEQIFFRGELRARRYKPWHPAFGFGILYELMSDFGHSISRPLLWLIAVSLISSWFYLGQYPAADVSPRAQLQARIVVHLPDSVRTLLFYAQARIVSHLPDRVAALLPVARAEALPTLTCKHGDGDPVRAAVLLSVRQSSVIGAFDGSKGTQIYACLYGYDEKLRAPVVPDDVVLWGIGQTVASAALLFLFLLALRNQFKIK